MGFHIDAAYYISRNSEMQFLSKFYKKYLPGPREIWPKLNTLQNHDALNRDKREYKIYERKIKRVYMRQVGNKMSKLKNENPRLFYSLFKDRKPNKSYLNTSDFFEYFKSLVSEIEINRNVEFREIDSVFEELDVQISSDEIYKTTEM